MWRTAAVGHTTALALCVVTLLHHMHVVTAVGTQLGSVQFPMLEPLRDDERQPPPDLSPFLAKEPDEVPPAPPSTGLRDFSSETMARMHPKLQRMIERERTMAAFAERYSNTPQSPPPPPPPDHLMNFDAPLRQRVNAGVSQQDVYRMGYQSALRRARAAKAGATDVPEDRPKLRRAKEWSEVLKEQFEAEENRLEALRSAPPSPDAGEWVDGVYHSHTGLNPESNASEITYKTATLTATPREEILKDWALGRHNAPLPTTFVTFLPIDPAAGLPEGDLRAAAYQRVLYAFKTACKLHPNARIVVLTDYTTRHSDLRFLKPYSTGFLGSNGVRLPCAVTINPPPPPPPDVDPTLEQPAAAAAAARRRDGGRVQLLEEARYLEELAAQGAKHHVVFFDVKHLFVDTLDRLFDNHFDVGFVFHNSDGPGLDTPLNLHMKFVHGGKANFRGAARLWRDAAAAIPDGCRRSSHEEGGGACDDTALRRVLTDSIPNLQQQRQQRGENATTADPVTYLYVPIGRTPMDVRLVPCSLYSAVPGGSFMGSCRPGRLTKALHIMGAEAKARMNELFKDVWHGRGDVAVQKAVAASQPSPPKAKAKSHG